MVPPEAPAGPAMSVGQLANELNSLLERSMRRDNAASSVSVGHVLELIAAMADAHGVPVEARVAPKAGRLPVGYGVLIGLRNAVHAFQATGGLAGGRGGGPGARCLVEVPPTRLATT